MRFRDYHSNKESTDNFDSKDNFPMAYHMDHFINWMFLAINSCFQAIGWKLLKHHFSPFKGNYSNKKWSDIFGPMQTFRRPQKEFGNRKSLAKPYGFGGIWEKLLTGPFVLFLVIAVMFFFKIPTSDLWRIPEEFCSN